MVGDVPGPTVYHLQHESRAGRFDHRLGPIHHLGRPRGSIHLSIVDKTSNHSFSKYARSSQYQSPLAAQRSSAEWIVEAPGVPTLPLADFGSVTFTNA